MAKKTGIPSNKKTKNNGRNKANMGDLSFLLFLKVLKQSFN